VLRPNAGSISADALASPFTLGLLCITVCLSQNHSRCLSAIGLIFSPRLHRMQRNSSHTLLRIPSGDTPVAIPRGNPRSLRRTYQHLNAYLRGIKIGLFRNTVMICSRSDPDTTSWIVRPCRIPRAYWELTVCIKRVLARIHRRRR